MANRLGRAATFAVLVLGSGAAKAQEGTLLPKPVATAPQSSPAALSKQISTDLDAINEAFTSAKDVDPSIAADIFDIAKRSVCKPSDTPPTLASCDVSEADNAASTPQDRIASAQVLAGEIAAQALFEPGRLQETAAMLSGYRTVVQSASLSLLNVSGNSSLRAALPDSNAIKLVEPPPVMR